jgi:hypothetical protein
MWIVYLNLQLQQLSKSFLPKRCYGKNSLNMWMCLGVNATHWHVGKSMGPALMSEQFQNKNLIFKRGLSIECMMFREHSHGTKFRNVEGEACQDQQCCNSHFSKYLALVQL